MAGYNFQRLKFFKNDRSPDTEMAQAVYENCCSDDEDFEKMWSLDGHMLVPGEDAQDYGQNADPEFPVTVFENYAPEKFEATVQMESTSSLDWELVKYTNGNGLDQLSSEMRRYYHICSISEDFFFCEQDMRIYSGWRGDVSLWTVGDGDQESRVLRDEDKNLIAMDFEGRHLLDSENNFIQSPEDFDHLEDTGTPIPQIETEVTLRISNYSKDPSLRSTLEELEKDAGHTFDSFKTDLSAGTISGVIRNTKDFKYKFDRLLRKHNGFNATVKWSDGTMSYNHGECTFIHEEE